jgi:hypothetical protein
MVVGNMKIKILACENMGKTLLFLIIFLFLIPLVLADVNISVNVTPTTTTLPPTPTQIFARMWIGVIALLLGAGGLVFIFRTFVEGSSPREKIDLLIGGTIVFVLIIYVIGWLLGI